MSQAVTSMINTVARQTMTSIISSVFQYCLSSFWKSRPLKVYISALTRVMVRR